MLRTLYPCSRHNKDRCIWCGQSFQTHLKKKWTKIMTKKSNNSNNKKQEEEKDKEYKKYSCNAYNSWLDKTYQNAILCYYNNNNNNELVVDQNQNDVIDDTTSLRNELISSFERCGANIPPSIRYSNNNNLVTRDKSKQNSTSRPRKESTRRTPFSWWNKHSTVETPTQQQVPIQPFMLYHRKYFDDLDQEQEQELQDGSAGGNRERNKSAILRKTIRENKTNVNCDSSSIAENDDVAYPSSLSHFGSSNKKIPSLASYVNKIFVFPFRVVAAVQMYKLLKLQAIDNYNVIHRHHNHHEI